MKCISVGRPNPFDRSFNLRVMKIKAEEWKRLEKIHHDKFALKYTLRYRNYNRFKESRVNRVIRRRNSFFYSSPITRLLDCGSGPGYETVELCRLASSVVAFDISHNMLKICRRKAVKAEVGSTKIKYIVGDVERLPFKKRVFDFVNIRGTLHHIPVVEEGLSEALRCLESGGRLVVEEPNVNRCKSVDFIVKVVEKIGKIALRKKVKVVEHFRVGTSRERALSGKKIFRLLKTKGVEGRMYFHTEYPYSFQIFGDKGGRLIIELADFVHDVVGRGEGFNIFGVKKRTTQGKK